MKSQMTKRICLYF